MADAEGHVLAAVLVVGGQLHEMVVIDGALVTDLVEGFGDAEHRQVAGVGDGLLVPITPGDGTVDVAEVDVEDLSLPAEMFDALEYILARLVARTHAEGHAVVG